MLPDRPLRDHSEMRGPSETLPPPVKGHCPDCGPARLADVVGHHHKRESDENVWAETDYRILRCRGCETVYFQTDLVFSEDWDYEVNPHTGEHEGYYPHKVSYWPAPSKREQPAWSSELFGIDSDLDSLLTISMSP